MEAKMKTTKTTAEKIARFAAEHIQDCDGDRTRALYEMDDEPGEVARACDCSIADVQTGLDAAHEVTDEAIDQLRVEAAVAGDEAQVRLCELALAEGRWSREECRRVIMETRLADAFQAARQEGR